MAISIYIKKLSNAPALDEARVSSAKLDDLIATFLR